MIFGLNRSPRPEARLLMGFNLWLGIFEFGIEWLTSIHVALDTENSVNQQRPAIA